MSCASFQHTPTTHLMMRLSWAGVSSAIALCCWHVADLPCSVWRESFLQLFRGLPFKQIRCLASCAASTAECAWHQTHRENRHFSWHFSALCFMHRRQKGSSDSIEPRQDSCHEPSLAATRAQQCRQLRRSAGGLQRRAASLGPAQRRRPPRPRGGFGRQSALIELLLLL